jgi:hypothetical protein
MRHRSSTILLALLMASLAPSLLAGQSLDLSGSAFAADYLVKLIEPDAFFKPLSPPAFVPVEGLATGLPAWVQDDDWCIVVDRPGGSLVYPIPVMIWHEVANDRSQGLPPLCVSYCILTGTAAVFDEDFGGGQRSEFGVSGYLYESNLVMFDYQTRSLWSQVGLKAMSGLERGRTLPLAPYRFMRWSEARKASGAKVCVGTGRGSDARYQKPPMEAFASYPTDDAIRSKVDPAALGDARHPRKELFIYFPATGRAVSFLSLGRGDLPGIEVLRSGTKVLSVSSAEPFITVYWFALRAFYPDARLE